MYAVLCLFILSLCTLWVSCAKPAPDSEKAKAERPAPLSEATIAHPVPDSFPPDEAEWSYEEAMKLENYLVAKPASADITVINKKAGVFISPDSLQVKSLKKENGEENFYTIADDNIYYEYEAGEFLKKQKVAEIHPGTRYLKFISNTKTYYFDTRAKAAGGWITILFDPEKPAPKIINPADIDTEYEEYMHQ